MTAGKQLKDSMLRIMRTAKVIKDHAYDITEDTELQMRSLTLQVKEAAAFIETLKIQEEDSTQQSLILDTEHF